MVHEYIPLVGWVSYNPPRLTFTFEKEKKMIKGITNVLWLKILACTSALNLSALIALRVTDADIDSKSVYVNLLADMAAFFAFAHAPLIIIPIIFWWAVVIRKQEFKVEEKGYAQGYMQKIQDLLGEILIISGALNPIAILLIFSSNSSIHDFAVVAFIGIGTLSVSGFIITLSVVSIVIFIEERKRNNP